MRPLHRLYGDDKILEPIELAVEIEHVRFAGAHQHLERLMIHRLRGRRLDAVARVFEQRAAAPDPEHQPPAAHVIEHANFFVEPQRVVQRQHIDQRAEADAARALSERGEEHARARHGAKRRRMVLGEVIAVEARRVGRGNEL